MSKSSQDTDEAFALFDKNEDGTIGIEDLRKVYQELGEDVPDKDLEALVRVLSGSTETDSTADLSVSLAQFSTLFNGSLRDPATDKEIADAMRIIGEDVKKCGSVHIETLAHKLKSQGNRFSDEEMEIFLKTKKKRAQKLASMAKLTSNMVFVGNGSTGKSSLVSMLLENGFQKKYQQTVGFETYKKEIRIKSKTISVRLWDIGGQNLGSKNLKQYVSAAHVLFYVYDITSKASFNDLEEWAGRSRDILSKEKQSSPVTMVLANKSDLQHLRKVSRDQHKRLVEKLGALDGGEVSAKTGERILEDIYRAAAKQHGISLSKSDLEFARRIVVARLDNSSVDEGRTKMADLIEAEDRAAMERSEGGCCVVS
eukprot:g1092.t1